MPLVTPAPPPALDEVLRWSATLEDAGSPVLAEGALLVNQALADFDDRQLEGVCSRLIDLAGQGLIVFLDPARSLAQLPAPHRIGKGSDFRVTAAGRDRLDRAQRPARTAITQIINATYAQVAGGDLTNYVSFAALLDDAQAKLNQLTDIDTDSRAEAQSILDKLRAATGQVALNAVGSGGGAVLGAILMALLGFH